MSNANRPDLLGRIVRPLNRQIGPFERSYGLACLRYSLAIVFFWFGIIKPLGRTPATLLVGETLAATPVLQEFVPFWVFMPVLGYWEALVGIAFLFRRTIKIAVACMMIQMASTFVPLLVVPSLTFDTWPVVPTTAGFYVIKNFVLMTSGLTVATLYGQTAPWLDYLLAGPALVLQRVRGVGGSLDATATRKRTTLFLLRAGLCVVFVWAGLLTLSGHGETPTWIATALGPTVGPGPFVFLIGLTELTIGLSLLSNRTSSIAAAFAVIYLCLSLLPLALQPTLPFNFNGIPVAVTFEGAFLIKDWILVSAVLVVDYGIPETAATSQTRLVPTGSS